MKILITGEVDAENRRLSEALGGEGHECCFVADGALVIDTVYREQPDAILLSLFLPECDSIDILSRLKTAPSTREIPIIIVTPRRLKRKLRICYQKGVHDYVLKPYFTAEVLARLRHILLPLQAIGEMRGNMVRDFLTGLNNRKLFMERFAEELVWAIAYHEPLSLFLLDIDHFKKINDTFGHSCGDEILKQVATIISSHGREGDVVARYGGEEFVGLLPNTDQPACFARAENLRSLVESFPFANYTDDKPIRLTVSIGFVTYQETDPKTIDQLLQEADMALYRAKAEGRNRVVGQICNCNQEAGVQSLNLAGIGQSDEGASLDNGFPSVVGAS